MALSHQLREICGGWGHQRMFNGWADPYQRNTRRGTGGIEPRQARHEICALLALIAASHPPEGFE